MKIPKKIKADGMKLMAFIEKKAKKADKRKKLLRLPKEEILSEEDYREEHTKPEIEEFWKKPKKVEIPKNLPAHPKWGRQFRVGHSYGFYDEDGQKLIGFFFKKKELFKDTVHLWVKESAEGNYVKYIVPRSRVSFDPWDAVPNVPREAPPPCLNFKPRYLPQYSNSGQSKAKGILVTPAIKRQMERDE